MLVVLFVTVLVDVWKHKIPNVFLILLILIQILSKSISATHYLTVGFIFFILFFFFSIGAIGAGDVKLITVLNLSAVDPLKFTCIVFTVGAIISLFRMLAGKNLIVRLCHLRNYIGTSMSEGRVMPYLKGNETPEEKKRYSVHLSIPVFLAYLAVCIIPVL